MTKRLVSIFSRSAELDEKLKGFFLLLVFMLSGVGAFAVYSWGSYWLGNEPAYLMTEGRMVWISITNLSVLIFSIFLLVSMVGVRMSYRESTHLREVEKGYHEPIMRYDEPIAYNHALEEKREFKAGVSRGSQTDFVPVDMTASQVIDTLDRLPLSPNQIRLYMDEYKSWEPVHSYLSKRKQRANIEAVHNIPDKIERGKEMYFPV